MIGNDASLPASMFEATYNQIWSLIKVAQDLLDAQDEEENEEDRANVTVVGPALLLLTKGTVEEKLEGVIEIVSKG